MAKSVRVSGGWQDDVGGAPDPVKRSLLQDIEAEMKQSLEDAETEIIETIEKAPRVSVDAPTTPDEVSVTPGEVLSLTPSLSPSVSLTRSLSLSLSLSFSLSGFSLYLTCSPFALSHTLSLFLALSLSPSLSLPLSLSLWCVATPQEAPAFHLTSAGAEFDQGPNI